MREKIAIIGGGIAGLTAGYLLSERHDVVLYEKTDRVGGNALTVTMPDGHCFDTSVFAFSRTRYVNFMKLLSKLNVTTARLGRSAAQFTMRNLDTGEVDSLDPQSPNPMKMLVTSRVLIAIKRGIKLLEQGKLDGLTTREAVRLVPGLTGKVQLRIMFLICLASSMYYEEVMDAPAEYVFGKLKLFFSSLKDMTAFCYVEGKTIAYINALKEGIKGEIVLNATIERVSRDDSSVQLKMRSGEKRVFDRVIFACNPDNALALLESPTPEESKLLGAWRMKDALGVIHKDDRHMPPTKQRSSYVFLYTERDGKIHTSVNALYCFQVGTPSDSPYIGSQHLNFPVDPTLFQFQGIGRIPIFDRASFNTIPHLPSLNGVARSYYCGSHFGFGLHEDSISSAIAAAKMLGAEWS